MVGANMSRASFGPTIGKLRIVHIPEAGVLRDVPRGCKILACTILCGLTAPWANRLTSMDTRKNLQVLDKVGSIYIPPFLRQIDVYYWYTSGIFSANRVYIPPETRNS